MNIQDEFLDMQKSKTITRADIKNFVNKIYTEQNLYKAIDIREFISKNFPVTVYEFNNELNPIKCYFSVNDKQTYERFGVSNVIGLNRAQLKNFSENDIRFIIAKQLGVYVTNKKCEYISPNSLTDSDAIFKKLNPTLDIDYYSTAGSFTFELLLPTNQFIKDLKMLSCYHYPEEKMVHLLSIIYAVPEYLCQIKLEEIKAQEKANWKKNHQQNEM